MKIFAIVVAILHAGCNHPTFSPMHRPDRHAPAGSTVGISVDVPPVQLAPGDESFGCFIFPLDLPNGPEFIAAGQLTVGPGLHHGNIMTRKQTGIGARTCPSDPASQGTELLDIFDGGTVLFGSSVQISGSEWQTFPAGMAFRVRPGFEIVARMHYLNATSSPVTVAPHYDWYTIPQTMVTEELAPFLWVYRPFEIPPQSELTVTGECGLQTSMHIVNILPHTHKLGKQVGARFLGGAFNGKPFLQATGFDPVNGTLFQYDPAIDLSESNGIQFSCTWFNSLDKTIVEGTGDNEMCMIGGYAYPPANATSLVASGSHACFTATPYQN